MSTILTDKAYLIHRQARGDTSLHLYLFTENHGLLRAYYKGGRNLRKKQLLQPFTALWIELTPGHHQHFIRKAEAQETVFYFPEQALICALYINELLFHTLKQPEPARDLFLYYENTLKQLSQCTEGRQMALCLREFEWILLENCGFAFSMQKDTNGSPVEAEQRYQFNPEYGFKPAHEGIPGQIIIAMAQGDFKQEGVHRHAKQIMRQAIDHLLDYRIVHARKLLYDFHSL